VPPLHRRRGDKPPPDARDSALRLLSRREHSARELKRKLADRGVESADADAAIEKLAGGGLQSDERYAGQLVRTRVAQGYGPIRIQSELRMAGLSGEAITQALDAAECDWDALALQVHAKKFRTGAKGMAERNRQYRFLMGRGFDGDQIRRALKADPAED
jgi:regulatory protein